MTVRAPVPITPQAPTPRPAGTLQTLKHLVLVDLFGIAGGFLLRAAGGAWIIGVEISSWLYLCTLLGALFLGLGKRRHELLVLEDTAVGPPPRLGPDTTRLPEG